MENSRRAPPERGSGAEARSGATEAPSGAPARAAPKLLSPPMHEVVSRRLAEVQEPVELLYFGRSHGGTAVLRTLQLCQLLSETNPLVRLRVLDAASDRKRCEELSVLFFPTVIISGKNRGSLRFWGTPSGHQLPVLAEALSRASSGEAGLRPGTVERLSGLKRDLTLKVFVAPHCAVCPRASLTALRLAVQSARVRTEVLNFQDFPVVSRRYGVTSPPKTVVNDRLEIGGSLPETELVERLLEAVVAQTGMYR